MQICRNTLYVIHFFDCSCKHTVTVQPHSTNTNNNFLQYSIILLRLGAEISSSLFVAVSSSMSMLLLSTSSNVTPFALFGGGTCGCWRLLWLAFMLLTRDIIFSSTLHYSLREDSGMSMSRSNFLLFFYIWILFKDKLKNLVI